MTPIMLYYAFNVTTTTESVNAQALVFDLIWWDIFVITSLIVIMTRQFSCCHIEEGDMQIVVSNIHSNEEWNIHSKSNMVEAFVTCTNLYKEFSYINLSVIPKRTSGVS